MTSRARRIVSFLPSATEMVYALGLGDRLMGVTHECDFPPEAKSKATAVTSVLPVERMTQREIDDAVSATLRAGGSLYRVDETLMRDIAPDLILTQDLCQVCAPSGNEITRLLNSLPSKPDVLWMTPKSLAEIFGNVGQLAAATGCEPEADALIEQWTVRLNAIAERARARTQTPRVFCMEWVDPVYCSGHWVPEMVRIAGGSDELGRMASDSVRIAWDDVLSFAPEVLIVMPCGFALQKAYEQALALASFPNWANLPAVQNGRVYVVDANAYFARPGPRVVDGNELLAHLIHPELFDWTGPCDAYRRLMFDLRIPRTKHCSRCGSPFTCGPENGASTCWCATLPHLKPSGNFDCMCPACLSAEIERHALGEQQVPQAH